MSEAEDTAKREVSIPYFTGRPLQLARSGVAYYRLPDGFNPLLHGATSATALGTASGGEVPMFQSPTSRGDLCNGHCELGRPPLASPGEPIVVILSSGPNSEGGGQPPPFEGRFEVDHPTGVIHSRNLISDRPNNPPISIPKPKNIYPR